MRYTGAASTLPREVVPMDKGVLLRFDVALDATKAADPDNYSLTSWHYMRTYQYGSPQLKADGTPGSDRLAPSSAYLSKDGRSVFVGCAGHEAGDADARRLVARDRRRRGFQDSAYFTPYELPTFDPEAEGFGDLTVDLVAAGPSRPPRPAPVSVEEGRRVYELYGCIACHAREAVGRSRSLARTSRACTAPTARFRTGSSGSPPTRPTCGNRSCEPAAKVVTGFNRTGMGMPSFAGVLTEQQIESVILYIKSLK